MTNTHAPVADAQAPRYLPQSWRVVQSWRTGRRPSWLGRPGQAGGNPGPWWEWRQLLLPAGVAALQIGLTLGAEHHHRPVMGVGSFGWVLLLVGPAALLARQRRPVAGMWVCFVAADVPDAPRFGYLSLIVAFVLVIAAGHRLAAGAMIAVAYVGALWLVPVVRGEHTASMDHALLLGGWLAVLAVAGEVVRARRDHATADRAARLAEVGRRRSEERLRMARDLHDIVGHNIALISVQAAAGLDLFDRNPEQARQSLAAIRTVAKEALDELRAVLTALRRDGDEVPHTPAPGVARLPELIAASRAAGLAVLLQSDGTPIVLPPAVDLAAYRIVQESLTNIARHAAPAATATVRLSYQPDRLLLRVHNDGPAGSGNTSAGTGIAGMRDRATALGGLLTAGPDPAGGFTVAGEFPVDEPS